MFLSLELLRKEVTVFLDADFLFLDFSLLFAGTLLTKGRKIPTEKMLLLGLRASLPGS